jgi:hypothetical protein
MTLVNALPEVAHNYERQHKLNMWFVLACEKPDQIAEAAARIEGETGLKVLRFPETKRVFHRLPGRGMTLDATDRRILKATAGGLPLTPHPFEEVARWLFLPRTRSSPGWPRCRRTA